MIHKIAFAAALALAAPAFAETATPIAQSGTSEQRILPIEGSHNFRDVGGYRTADGRMVRWGVFYRSGSMARLTPSGMQQLQALRLGSIIDLRSSEERRADMSNWLAMSGQGYWARNYALNFGNMAAMMGDPAKLTEASVKAMMADGYRSTVKDQAPAYRELFARLTAPGNKAVAVNCSAGKDRTGIATALVLTALGVPYDTVREDFLLSNAASATQALKRDLGGQVASAFAAVPPEAVAALAGVDGSYLDAAFDQMRKDHGSVEGYLQAELGVGEKEIAAMKRRMLI